DALAQRVTARPILSRQRFVDDDHGLRSLLIVLRKSAAFEDRNTHSLKIIRSANAISPIVLLSWWRLGSAFDQERIGRVRAAKRQVVNDGCRLHARQSFHSLHQIGIES